MIFRINSFFVFIFLTLSSCNETIDNNSIQGDEFVKSLKKNTNKETIASIDSVLNLNSKHKHLSLLLFEKGVSLSKRQEHNKAINSFEKTKVLLNTETDKELLMDLYWHLGSSNTFANNIELATDQLIIALDYSKELNDKKTESNVYSSLAHTYYLYKDYGKAIEYMLKAIEIQTLENDSFGISATYNNLAVIYKNTGNYQSALDYNLKSLEINKHFNDENGVAKSYNNLGLLSDLLMQKESAILFFHKAISINKLEGLNNSSPLRNLADLFQLNNQLDSAKYYYHKALDVEKNKENSYIKKNIYNALLNVSLIEKDLSNSLVYQLKRDSFINIIAINTNKKKLESLENQFQLSNSKKDLILAKSINKKNKIIFGISTFIIFLLGLYWFQTVKNKKLKAEKEKLSLEQQVLRSQMNPHFIFNVLSSIQNSLLDNNPLKSASYISKFAKLIRQNFDFINEKTILLKDEIDALQNYMDTQKMRYDGKFSYEFNIFAEIDINVIEIPPLLIQPFVENAIEHGFKNKKEKGLITINVSKIDDSICYEIKDNGKGFSTLKNDDKLHSIDVFKKRLKLLGSNEDQSVKIQSNEKGTIIKFCLKQ